MSRLRSPSARRVAAMFALALGALSGVGARADERLLTFEPSEAGAIGPLPADGLNVEGVLFGYTEGGLASPNAVYGDPGVGTLTYVDGAVLLGRAVGTLTLDFEIATPLLELGVALNTIGNVMPGYHVELFDESLASLGVADVDTASLIGFSEGHFSHVGAPIKRAVVTFSTSYPQLGGNREYVLDNLRYEVPPPAVPMLPAGGIAAAFVALLGTALRYRASVA